MLCYDIVCYVMLRHVMICCVTLWHAHFRRRHGARTIAVSERAVGAARGGLVAHCGSLCIAVSLLSLTYLCAGSWP